MFISFSKVCMEGVGLLFHHSKVRFKALYVCSYFCQLIYVIYTINIYNDVPKPPAQNIVLSVETNCKFWYDHTIYSGKICQCKRLIWEKSRYIEWWTVIDCGTSAYDSLYTMTNGVRAGIASLFQYCIGAVSALLLSYLLWSFYIQRRHLYLLLT